MFDSSTSLQSGHPCVQFTLRDDFRRKVLEGTLKISIDSSAICSRKFYVDKKEFAEKWDQHFTEGIQKCCEKLSMLFGIDINKIEYQDSPP